MAWGLTSKYSHDEKQNAMGDFFMKEMKSIFDSYRAADEESEEQPKHIEHYTSEGKVTEEAEKKKKEKRFVESTIMALSKTIRNLALARDAHVVYLQSKAQEYIGRKEYLDEISSFSSFSPEGLLPKIITFVGGGSVITALKEFRDLYTNLQQTEINTIKSIINSTTDAELKTELTRRLVEAQVPFTPSLSDILVFVGAGVAVMTAVTFIVKYWKNHTLCKKLKEIEDESGKYWKKEVRVTIGACLFDLYRDMRAIMKEFDENYRETCFISSHQIGSEIIDDNTAKSIIEREIIHPLDIDYHNPLVRLADQPVKEEDKPAKKEEKEEDTEKEKKED
jgi:hypothetical protein